ncbi:hypothetical protein [Mesorhizobium sp. M0036]|uniref:hypothetical protein n=1 Tax=Mesorhizobium sp. M0036 TaxID=2956853 RepID=UPI00333844B7
MLKDFDIDDDDLLRRWISISQKVKSFHIRGLSADQNPSRDPDDYKGYKWTGPRINAKGIVNGLYSRAKKGDLVLVTSPGVAWGRTSVGELLDPPDEYIYERIGRYPRENIPARRVRWLGTVDNTVLEKGFVSQLVSQSGFSQVRRSDFDVFFRAAYPNFIRTDLANSLFNIQAEEFSTVADMYLKLIANFAAEIARADERGTLKDLPKLKFDDWMFSLSDDEFVANQKIKIESPGKNLLQSIKMTPILAAVIFAVCQYPAADIKASEIEFKNSANGGPLDECDIPIKDASGAAFNKMSLDLLEKMCKAAQTSEKLGRITTPIRTVTK